MTPTLEQLSTVIARIHEAGTAPEKWPEALAAILGLLQAPRTALFDMAADTGQALTFAQVGHDPDVAEEYLNHYYQVDPTRAHVLSVAPLMPTTTNAHFPASFRKQDEYFNFARRCDIGDVIGLSTRIAEGRRQVISVQRTYRAADFDGRSKELLALLAPHLELAKRVQWKIADAVASKSALEASLDRLALAALLLDARGQVHHLNRAAQSLLARSRELTCRHGRMALRDAMLNSAFQAALRAAAREEGRSAALAIRLSETDHGEVLVAPLQGSGTNGGPAQPMALVLVATSPSDEEAIARRLQQAYRLTSAESRVAAMLAMGQSLEQIAATNKVSDATVRTQLRSILSKTGARRQADIVRVALAGAVLRLDR